MKKRKALKIKDLVAITNHYLANSHANHVEQRKSIAEVVGNILHDTGNYNGFNYLDSESDLHAGHYGKDGRVFFYGAH